MVSAAEAGEPAEYCTPAAVAAARHFVAAVAPAAVAAALPQLMACADSAVAGVHAYFPAAGPAWVVEEPTAADF